MGRCCSVLGCSTSTPPLYSFPDPIKSRELFIRWVEASDPIVVPLKWINTCSKEPVENNLVSDNEWNFNISNIIPENEIEITSCNDIEINHDQAIELILDDYKAKTINKKMCGICEKHIKSGEFQNCANYAHTKCAENLRNINWKCNGKSQPDPAIEEYEFINKTLINENTRLKQLLKVKEERKSSSMLQNKIRELERKLRLCKKL